jgi:peptidoglycan hydrolase CwlO-like protein
MVPAHAEIYPLPEKFYLLDFLITVFQNITNQFNIAEDERDDLKNEIKDLKKDIKDIEKDIKDLKKEIKKKK